MADAYLPIWVYDLPASWAFQHGGALRDNVRHAVSLGVTKVIAGPTRCHLRIDVRRPYFRPVSAPSIEATP